MSTRPFPDFRRDGGLSASELNRLQSEVERLTNLRAEAPLELADTATGPLLRWNGPDIFLARLTGVFTPTGGAQAGINLYSFIEQIYDAASGIPKDATPGRRTYPAAPTQPVNGYALEVKNATLTVPGTTPPGYTNAGPYVEMRLKGFVLGAPVYEFDGGSGGGGTTLQYVKVTSNTSATIIISGVSNTAYPAVLTSFVAGAWADTATAVWFISANGDIPTQNNRYAGTSFGTAGDGKAVWGEDVVNEAVWIKVTSLTSSNVTVDTGGAIITVYPATISTWNTQTGVWTDGAPGSVWYYPLNAGGVVPGLNSRYECLPFGVDSGGKTIFGSDFGVAATATNWGVVTTVSQEFAGAKTFDASVGVGGTNSGIGSFTVSSPNLSATHGVIVYGDSPGVSSNAICIVKSSLGSGAFIGINDIGGVNKAQLTFQPSTGTLLGNDGTMMFYTGNIIASNGFGVGTTPTMGLTTTVTYVKTVNFVGQTVTTGTLTFTGGILTGST